MKYRKALQSDLPQILELLKSVKGDTSGLVLEKIIAACEQERVVGCVRIKEIGNCLELVGLAVLHEYRNKGIGSVLVKKIIEENKQRPIFLLCFADRENFYSRNGFELTEINDVPEVLRKEYMRVKNEFPQSGKNIIAMILN